MRPTNLITPASLADGGCDDFVDRFFPRVLSSFTWRAIITAIVLSITVTEQVRAGNRFGPHVRVLQIVFGVNDDEGLGLAPLLRQQVRILDGAAGCRRVLAHKEGIGGALLRETILI